jgi:hypothetical protein
MIYDERHFGMEADGMSAEISVLLDEMSLCPARDMVKDQFRREGKGGGFCKGLAETP